MGRARAVANGHSSAHGIIERGRGHNMMHSYIKFIYSEKATNVCEIFSVNLPYVVTVKSMVEIPQTFVAFSEHMNFKSSK